MSITEEMVKKALAAANAEIDLREVGLEDVIGPQELMLFLRAALNAVAADIVAAENEANRAALEKAEKALGYAEPWVEAGPAGRWRDSVLAHITDALAAIRARRTP